MCIRDKVLRDRYGTGSVTALQPHGYVCFQDDRYRHLFLRPTLSAVSYTHLDVYKRQAITFAARFGVIIWLALTITLPSLSQIVLQEKRPVILS